MGRFSNASPLGRQVMAIDFSDVHYLGSFQRGKHLRSSDPNRAAWREVEKLGTVDRMSDIAKRRGHPESVARPASLRVRQAIELWKSSRGTSALTRPLLLYYAMLNLVRGIMLPRTGTIGERSHGLSYQSGTDLLSCKATVTKGGTFRRHAESLGLAQDMIDGRSYTLRDLLAVIPEMLSDFPLLRCGTSSVVRVLVRALMRGPIKLVFDLPDIDDERFASEWAAMFPWWKELCALDSGTVLRLKKDPENYDEICDLCRKHLMHDLRLRDDAFWYDHRVGSDVVLLPRQLAYMGACYILSNVSRYEPELLDAPTSGLNDLGFVLESFLDNAERFFPQLTVELLYGEPVFFE